jgi:two-component system, NtrC family, sensor kinase
LPITARAPRNSNITLQRALDPAAGKAQLFPQEITRVLLNLISNGFYAASKRRAETNGGDYEPILSAVTKNLGDSVEIRIRDNGTGIPPEVKDKMFNPFQAGGRRDRPYQSRHHCQATFRVYRG